MFIHNLIKFIFKVSLYDKKLYIEAFILMGLIRFEILNIPFNKLKDKLGNYNIETVTDINISKNGYKIARKIKSIVVKTSKYTPWESLCLVQAVTVQQMLKKRGLSTTMYLGVSKDKDNNIIAHAWIRYGEVYLTGGDGNGYAVVAKFTN